MVGYVILHVLALLWNINTVPQNSRSANISMMPGGLSEESSLRMECSKKDMIFIESTRRQEKHQSNMNINITHFCFKVKNITQIIINEIIKSIIIKKKKIYIYSPLLSMIKAQMIG